jgi:hypothetical protein
LPYGAKIAVSFISKLLLEPEPMAEKEAEFLDLM